MHDDIKHSYRIEHGFYTWLENTWSVKRCLLKYTLYTEVIVCDVHKHSISTNSYIFSSVAHNLS